MPTFLVVEPDPDARQSIESALGGLGYDLLWIDSPADLASLDVEVVDLVMTSVDCFGHLGRREFLRAYEKLPSLPSVVLWSRELSRSRLIELMPPEVVLGAVFEWVPRPAELLLFVSGRFPPRRRGAAVQRLLKELSRRRSAVSMVVPRGTYEIADLQLPRALVSLARAGWSGNIVVDPLRSASLHFWFDGGTLVMAGDGTTGTLLQEARRRGLDRGMEDPPGPFEDIRDELQFMRRSGGLSKVERVLLVVWRYSELLSRASAVTEGRVHVVDYAEAPIRIDSGSTIEKLLLASAAEHPAEVLKRGRPSGAWFVLPALPLEEELQSWNLTGVELALCEYLESNRTTRITVDAALKMMGEVDCQPEQVEGLLIRLVEMGYLSFVGSPFDQETEKQLYSYAQTCRSAQRGDYFSLLGVSRQASKEAVDAAVLDASRRWHPDALVDSDPRVQALGALLFAMIREAGATLGDKERRLAYVEDLQDGQLGRGGKDPDRARILLAKGKISLKAKSYGTASQELEAAAAADPTLAEARLLSIWASWLAKPQMVDSGIESLQKIARQPNASPQTWYFLGRMYLHSKNPSRARSCFKRALKIDPAHRDSLSELRLLERRTEQSKDSGKKSFFDRLRGR